jgi:hypothetical protein
MVEKLVKSCQECQANTDRQSFESLIPSNMPDEPWKEVSGDFYGPMDDGSYWYVNHCDYSRWAQVDRITATSEDQVEPILDNLFSIFGSPEIYKTDNGSPFQSWRFKEFAIKWGFKHRRVTPEWPRANGEAESFMKKLNKVLKTCKVSGLDKNVALQEFLRRYRETPHSTTKVAPNILLMGFSRTSGIPGLPITHQRRKEMHQLALKNDRMAKKRMELEYNNRMKTRESQIRVGSKVLIKLQKNRKSTSSWDVVNPYVVKEIKGSMITAARYGHRTTRNSSCFKLYRDDLDIMETEEVVTREEDESEATQVVNDEFQIGNEPASNEHGGAEQEGSAVVPPTPKEAGKPGRPTKAQAKVNAERQQQIQAAKLIANPPTRVSARQQAKQ